MGYTHYWTQPKDFTSQEMGDIAASIRLIIREADCDIVGPHGDEGSPPVLTKKNIAFNGRDENSHETFYLGAKRELPYDGADPERLGWTFCKTANKPYDVVVVACLTFLQQDYGFKVSSDGDIPDWDLGVELAERALGKQFANPLVIETIAA